MRIVCPYEPKVHRLTRQSLRDHAGAVEFVRLGEDRTAYWQCLCRLWADKTSVILIEHDIEIHERTVPELTGCPEPWCLFPYSGARVFGDVGGDTLFYGALGCTRFRAEVMETQPDLIAAIGVREGTGADPRVYRDWSGLDRRILNRLKDFGYRPHVHRPEVLHHHRYPQGCACGDDHDPPPRPIRQGVPMANNFYKWVGDHRVIFTQSVGMDGSTIEVGPGDEFETVEPIHDAEHIVGLVSLGDKSKKSKPDPESAGVDLPPSA